MHISMCYSSWGSSCELSLSAPVSQHPAGPQEMLVNGRGQKKGRNGLYHCEKVDLPFLESGPIVSIWSPSGVWLIAKSRGEGGWMFTCISWSAEAEARNPHLLRKKQMQNGSTPLFRENLWVRASTWDWESVSAWSLSPGKAVSCSWSKIDNKCTTAIKSLHARWSSTWDPLCLLSSILTQLTQPNPLAQPTDFPES